ncbi:response regulator [Mesorhizobium sp. M0614]
MSYKEYPAIDLPPSEALLPSPLLVVEDEPMMQVRLRSILKGLGYAQEELFFAGSIAQARTLLVDQPLPWRWSMSACPMATASTLSAPCTSMTRRCRSSSSRPGATKTPSSRPYVPARPATS